MCAPLIPSTTATCLLPPAPCYLVSGRNHIRRLLTNHVDRARDEQPGHTREHRCINNAQPLDPVHFEITAQHPAPVAPADRTAAGCVVAPRMGTYEIAERLFGRVIGARHLFDQPERLPPAC